MQYQSNHSTCLKGTAFIPGDKSMSHRALMFGLLASGTTTVKGLLEGEDVLATAAAINALGGKAKREADTSWHITGTGLGKLTNPQNIIDMGNSGTSARLLSGLIAGHEIIARMTGDASLCKRPMKRIITPLSQMGAKFECTEDGRLPMTITGVRTPKATEYHLPVASAQVKSAILLAGLTADGTTTVIEDKPTRDHTENMLRYFGVRVDIEDLGNGSSAIHIKGQTSPLTSSDIIIPSDPSSAAFAAVAAALVDGSTVHMSGIGMNPRRNGIFTTLIEMGADIEFSNQRDIAGEPVADIFVRGNGPLKAIDVPPDRVPSMIDEFPILAMAAACADGVTTMTGLAELRVKESDRLQMVANGLAACGVKLDTGEDSLTIYGNGKSPSGGAMVETELDHRIAMSFLVLGMVTDNPVRIDDAAPILTSFPNFIMMMNDLGADIRLVPSS